MAYVNFELPDSVVAEAKAAGISIPAVCEKALLSALSGPNLLGTDLTSPRRRSAGFRAPTATRGAGDDASRYSNGYDLGQRWAADRGTLEELRALVQVTSSRWHDVSLDVASHSLIDLLVEEGEIDRADDGTAWISRNAFSEGLADAVAAAISA